MDTFIISYNGNPRKSLRLTGRDGPARLNCLDGLVRLCHSGGSPGVSWIILGAPAWLARGNPVKYISIKMVGNKRCTKNRQHCSHQGFFTSFKNKLSSVSNGEFSNLLILHYANRLLPVKPGNKTRNMKVLSINTIETVLP